MKYIMVVIIIRFKFRNGFELFISPPIDQNWFILIRLNLCVKVKPYKFEKAFNYFTFSLIYKVKYKVAMGLAGIYLNPKSHVIKRNQIWNIA